MNRPNRPHLRAGRVWEFAVIPGPIFVTSCAIELGDASVADATSRAVLPPGA